MIHIRTKFCHAGALARLVEANGIVVLSAQDWAAKKQELGAAIWR